MNEKTPEKYDQEKHIFKKKITHLRNTFLQNLILTPKAT